MKIYTGSAIDKCDLITNLSFCSLYLDTARVPFFLVVSETEEEYHALTGIPYYHNFTSGVAEHLTAEELLVLEMTLQSNVGNHGPKVKWIYKRLSPTTAQLKEDIETYKTSGRLDQMAVSFAECYINNIKFSTSIAGPKITLSKFDPVIISNTKPIVQLSLFEQDQ